MVLCGSVERRTLSLPAALRFWMMSSSGDKRSDVERVTYIQPRIPRLWVIHALNHQNFVVMVLSWLYRGGISDALRTQGLKTGA